MTQKIVKKSTKEGIRPYLYVGISAFFVIAAAIGLYFILLRFDQIWGSILKLINILQPILMGLVVAYLLNPVMMFFERNIIKLNESRLNEKFSKGFIRNISIFLALLCAVLIFFVFGLIVVPELIQTTISLIKVMPGRLEALSNNVLNQINDNKLIAPYASTYISEATDWLENWMRTDLLTTVRTWGTYFAVGLLGFFSAIMNLIIGLIISIYVLKSKEHFAGQAKMVIYAIFSKDSAEVVIDTCRQSHLIFSGFIVGKLIDSLIIGILTFIGLSILHIPYVLIVSVIVGVTNIIPFFGPYIGAIPSALLILCVSPIHSLYFLIFILILQQIDGNIIGPNILGESTGLSAFWVIFSILVGNGIFGFLGMIIGVPLFAVIALILRTIVSNVLERKKMPNTIKDYLTDKPVKIERKHKLYMPKKPQNEDEEPSKDSIPDVLPTGNESDDKTSFEESKK
ncbi:MAG: AI-2E family transporter [Lachnospiraceae bacterium]|nr:AI-2E family transporter [Lachnospiraceae bacterium]